MMRKRGNGVNIKKEIYNFFFTSLTKLEVNVVAMTNKNENKRS